MPSLWIASEMYAGACPTRLLAVTKCDLYPDRLGRERYGPREEVYRGRTEASSLRIAASHLLVHLLSWTEPGDVVLSQGLTRQAGLRPVIGRLIKQKQVTVYGAGASPEDWTLRRECGAPLVLLRLNGGWDGLPVLDPLSDEQLRELCPPEPPPEKLDRPYESRPPGRHKRKLARPGFIHVPYEAGGPPKSWVASDISMPDGRGRHAGYAVCRMDESGAVSLVQSGVLTLGVASRTGEAERRGLAIACHLAFPGEGVLCDIMEASILAKINLKGLTVGRPFDLATLKLHDACHLHCGRVHLPPKAPLVTLGADAGRGAISAEVSSRVMRR
jgi:hypothetical protein